MRLRVIAVRQSPCAAKRGFTLVEILVSGLILAVGFTALFYWFVGNSIMLKRDRVRVEALSVLENEAEQSIAHPTLAKDSSWLAVVGYDTFALHTELLDSAKLKHIADSLALGPADAEVFTHRPRELHLNLRSFTPRPPYSTDLYLLIDGVSHVAQ